MSSYINHVHIDHDIVIDAIGDSYGQEWFYLLKCPECNEVYLYDRECDIVYLDSDDLSMLHVTAKPLFSCKVCEYTHNESNAPFSLEVTLAEAKSSSWNWIIKTNV